MIGHVHRAGVCTHRHHRTHGQGRPRDVAQLRINAVLRRDPARILTIQNAVVREFKREFALLKRDIRRSIIDNDCFGIQVEARPRVFEAIPDRAYVFRTVPEKIESFMEWLQKQQTSGILRIVTGPPRAGGPFSGIYVESTFRNATREAYIKGLERARAELRRSGVTVPEGRTVLSPFFTQPVHAERLEAIYGRAYEDLKTVQQFTSSRVRAAITEGLTNGLTKGLAEGKHPLTIARELVRDVNNQVDKIGLNRARLIARTEVARAHHTALVGSYRQAVDGGARLEFGVLTAADPCPDCDQAATKVYTLDEIAGLLPLHPQ